VGFVVAGVILLAALSPHITIAGRVPLDKPPAVLVDRAQQILASLGYSDPVADSASGFAIAQPFVRWAAATDERPGRWDILKTGSPPALVFWHRTSPRLLVPQRQDPQVTNNDPPMAVSGMTYLIVDTLGRMIEFQAVPPQFESDPAPAAAPRWETLFDAAGLTLASFTPVTPQWSPRDFADTRAAWEGPLTDHPEYQLHVEAASYRGRPVSMLVLGPWSRPTRMAAPTRSVAQSILRGFVSLVIVALVIAALLIARYNLRAHRADPRSAARLAIFVMVGYAATWVIGAHHVSDVQQEINAFSRYFGGVLMSAGVLWVIYLALEPYVRRFWPDGILGWTRLVSGYVRDPLVGRDVLTGCAFAVILAMPEMLFNLLPPLVGRPPALPLFETYVDALMGPASLLSILFDAFVNGIFIAMFAVLGYVLLRLALRRTSLAVAAALVLLSLVQAQAVLTSGAPMWMAAIYQLSFIAIITTVVVRYGLLVSAVAFAVGSVLERIPLTLSLSHWTAATSNVTIAIALGLTFFGFYASRAGQPLLGDFGADSKRP
jgi:serine/threonine-protein kinase